MPEGSGSVKDELTIYRMKICIPSVPMSSLKSNVQEFVELLKDRKLKIIKIRPEAGAAFKIGEEEFAHIYIYLKIKTNMDRRKLSKMFIPRYKVIKMSYSRKDAV